MLTSAKMADWNCRLNFPGRSLFNRKSKQNLRLDGNLKQNHHREMYFLAGIHCCVSRRNESRNDKEEQNIFNIKPSWIFTHFFLRCLNTSRCNSTVTMLHRVTRFNSILLTPATHLLHTQCFRCILRTVKVFVLKVLCNTQQVNVVGTLCN